MGVAAQVDHRGKPRTRRVVHPETNEPLTVRTQQCVLGPCERALYHRGKKKFAGPVPLVGAIRLQRKLVEEGVKNMEIVPIDPPTELETA